MDISRLLYRFDLSTTAGGILFGCKMSKAFTEPKRNEHPEIKECVRCGYCCKQGMCKWGYYRYREIIHKHGTEGLPSAEVVKWCPFLRKANNQLGVHYCILWDYIKFMDKGSKYPMCGSGCSSTLFNPDRIKVINNIKNWAVFRCLSDGAQWTSISSNRPNFQNLPKKL